jgi:hypothetical protein
MRDSAEAQLTLDELPRRLQTWFDEHEERLRSCGIAGGVQRSPEDGRTKTSIWVTLETDDQVAMLIVWSSGEAELECGDVATDRVRRQHRDLRTLEELLDAIETICEWIHTTGEATTG